MRSGSPETSYQLYLRDVARVPLLTVDEERELTRLYKRTRDAKARERLVASNQRFVLKVAGDYRSYGLELEDLVAEGNLGLLRALEKFEPERGLRFITYAVHWIRAFMQNHVLRSWSLVKIGTTQAQRKLFFSLERTRRKIEHLAAGHDDEVRMIAKRLRVKESEVREVEARMGRDLSLNRPRSETGAGEGNGEFLDLVAGVDVSAEDLLVDDEETKLLRERVARALARLDRRDRFVLEQRLMRVDGRRVTLHEIGEQLGCSRERVRQLELRARKKLREFLDADAE